MARYNFGGSLADFAILPPSGQSNVVKSQPNIVTGTAWSASTGGTQYTDMLISGVASTVVKTDTNGFVTRFQGPDGVTELWVDFGGGSRFHLTASASKVAKDAIVIDTRDYASPQAAIDACPVGGVVQFPAGNTGITTALSVTKSMTIRGTNHYSSMITATGCDGIVIAAGTGQVHIENIGIFTNIAYTTTVNALVGIKVSGTDASRCGYHTYRDIWIQGFWTAIQTTSLWNARFDNIQAAYGLIGIDAYGLGQNNFVRGCNIVCGTGSSSRVAGSVALRINGQVSPADSTSQQNEGWTITDNVFAIGDILVDFNGVSHCVLANNILDYAHLNAVRVTNNGTAYGGHIKISGNYMAMAGDSAATGGCVELTNTVSANAGAQIIGNKIQAYSGAGTYPYGIRVNTGNVGPAQIIGNNIGPNFTSSDIRMETGGSTVVANQCSSTGAGNHIVSVSALNLVSNNAGTNGSVTYIAGGAPNVYSQVGNSKVVSWTAAPSTGAWRVGDRVVNTAPAVGSPKAWVCTVAGTPGTWVSEGNL